MDEAPVRAALKAFHEAKRWARRDLSAAAIEHVESVSPRVLVLTTRYEERGLRYDLSDIRRTSTPTSKRPDLWQLPLEHDEDAAPGAQVEMKLEGVEVQMDCSMCRQMGKTSCTRCGGSGKQQERAISMCFACRGSGRVTCTSCEGSGTVFALPEAWSRIGETTITRVIETKHELPLDVLFDLQESNGGGETIAEIEGNPIAEVRFASRGTHYRQAVQADAELLRTAEQMVSTCDLPNNAHMLGQLLQLRQVPAWFIRFSTGRQAYLYGEPPKTHPPYALATMLGTTIGRVGGA